MIIWQVVTGHRKWCGVSEITSTTKMRRLYLSYVIRCSSKWYQNGPIKFLSKDTFVQFGYYTSEFYLFRASSLMVTGDCAEWFAKMGDSVENITKMKRPRYIKSHLPLDLLPQQIHQKKPKVFKFLTVYCIVNKHRKCVWLFQIIYVTRNPKDTCVSFYHYCKKFHNIVGSFEEFAALFLKDNSMHRPVHLLLQKSISIIIIKNYFQFKYQWLRFGITFWNSGQ